MPPSGKQREAVPMHHSDNVPMFTDAETEGCVGKESWIFVNLSDGKHKGQEGLVAFDCRSGEMTVTLKSE